MRFGQAEGKADAVPSSSVLAGAQCPVQRQQEVWNPSSHPGGGTYPAELVPAAPMMELYKDCRVIWPQQPNT